MNISIPVLLLGALLWIAFLILLGQFWHKFGTRNRESAILRERINRHFR